MQQEIQDAVYSTVIGTLCFFLDVSSDIVSCVVGEEAASGPGSKPFFSGTMVLLLMVLIALMSVPGVPHQRVAPVQ